MACRYEPDDRRAIAACVPSTLCRTRRSGDDHACFRESVPPVTLPVLPHRLDTGWAMSSVCRHLCGPATGSPLVPPIGAMGRTLEPLPNAGHSGRASAARNRLGSRPGRTLEQHTGESHCDRRPFRGCRRLLPRAGYRAGFGNREAGSTRVPGRNRHPVMETVRAVLEQAPVVRGTLFFCRRDRFFYQPFTVVFDPFQLTTR